MNIAFEVRAYFSRDGTYWQRKEFPYDEKNGWKKIMKARHLPRQDDQIMLKIHENIWALSVKRVIHPLCGKKSSTPIILIQCGEYFEERERDNDIATCIRLDSTWESCGGIFT